MLKTRRQTDKKVLEKFEIQQILKLLPHRYPFLLVDRVLECEPGKRTLAVKNVTINEPFFPGHFPGKPVMPGVMILEALAQSAGILAFRSQNEEPSDRALYYFVGIDNARFRRPVTPGDQMLMEVELLRTIRGVWRFRAKATVDGNLVCTADLMCAKRSYDD